MSKTRTVTTEFQASIRGDLGAVIAWWRAPARVDEQRAALEARSSGEVNWQVTDEDGRRTLNAEWLGKRGRKHVLRSIGTRSPDGLTSYWESHQDCSHPDGREHSYDIHEVLTFVGPQAGQTTVRLRRTVESHGALWIETLLSPFRNRRKVRDHLKGRASRCESDLAVTAIGD